MIQRRLAGVVLLHFIVSCASPYGEEVAGGGVSHVSVPNVPPPLPSPVPHASASFELAGERLFSVVGGAEQFAYSEQGSASGIYSIKLASLGSDAPVLVASSPAPSHIAWGGSGSLESGSLFFFDTSTRVVTRFGTSDIAILAQGPILGVTVSAPAAETPRVFYGGSDGANPFVGAFTMFEPTNDTRFQTDQDIVDMASSNDGAVAWLEGGPVGHVARISGTGVSRSTETLAGMRAIAWSGNTVVVAVGSEIRAFSEKAETSTLLYESPTKAGVLALATRESNVGFVTADGTLGRFEIGNPSAATLRMLPELPSDATPKVLARAGDCFAVVGKGRTKLHVLCGT